jgi:hypothetical protein
MEAWLTMMRSWKHRGYISSFSIPAVNSDRVGVWLNGALKLDGYWLLGIGIIPVYVIHIYQEAVDFPASKESVRDRRPRIYDVDFVQHTRAERLNSPAWNTYLVAPTQGGSKENLKVVFDSSQEVAQFIHDETSSARSASWSFRVSQRDGKLPADDTPPMHSAMNMTYTGQDRGMAVIAQGDPYIFSTRKSTLTWGLSVSYPPSSTHDKNVLTGNPTLPSCSTPRTLHRDVDRDSGWGSSSFGWGLASNSGWGPMSDYNKAIGSSGQKDCSKSSDPPTRTALHSQARMGELIIEGATAFWKPPPVQDCPKPRVTSKKGKAKEKQAKQVWSNFFEMGPAPGLPVEPGQTVMVQLNKSLLSEEDAKFASETEMEAPQSSTRCMFWDRAHGRCLTFFCPWEHDGRIYYDKSAFGFPLHDIRYWTKEGRRGYLPVGKPSTWAYFDPQPKSQNLVGTQLSLEDCRPRSVHSFSLPPPLSMALTSAPPEAPMFDDAKVQRPCEPAPSMLGGYDEKLDWGTDDEEFHSAAPTADPISSLASCKVADANTALVAEVPPAAAQFPDIQPKNAVTNAVKASIIAQKEQEAGCDLEITAPVLDSRMCGVLDDVEMGSESAMTTGECCFTL